MDLGLKNAVDGKVETAWTVVEPVLDNATPVHEYEPETWGPPEADAIAPLTSV